MVTGGSEIRVLGRRTFIHAPAGIPGKEWVGTDPGSEDLVSQAAAGSAKLRPVTGATGYRGWGTPVDIRPPPAGQVVDIGEPIKQMGR